MSFVPTNQGNSDFTSNIDWNLINTTVKAGSRPARISMIVDLGEQERDDYITDVDFNDSKQNKALADGKASIEEIEGKAQFVKPLDPIQQVAIFADLVSDAVPYGEDNKPYRIMLNNTWEGDIKGTAFAAGNKLQNGNWTFASNSLLTKLAMATETEEILDGTTMDISLMLNKPFMATIVKKDGDGGKTYVNYKGAAPVPEIEGYSVPELSGPALLVQFSEATKEQADMLRKGIKDKIKKAGNYEGSQMQKAIEESEAAFKAGLDSNPTASTEPTNTGELPAEDLEDDCPF